MSKSSLSEAPIVPNLRLGNQPGHQEKSMPKPLPRTTSRQKTQKSETPRVSLTARSGVLKGLESLFAELFKLSLESRKEFAETLLEDIKFERDIKAILLKDQQPLDDIIRFVNEKTQAVNYQEGVNAFLGKLESYQFKGDSESEIVRSLNAIGAEIKLSLPVLQTARRPGSETTLSARSSSDTIPPSEDERPTSTRSVTMSRSNGLSRSNPEISSLVYTPRAERPTLSARTNPDTSRSSTTSRAQLKSLIDANKASLEGIKKEWEEFKKGLKEKYGEGKKKYTQEETNATFNLVVNQDDLDKVDKFIDAINSSLAQPQAAAFLRYDDLDPLRFQSDKELLLSSNFQVPIPTQDAEDLKNDKKKFVGIVERLSKLAGEIQQNVEQLNDLASQTRRKKRDVEAKWKLINSKLDEYQSFVEKDSEVEEKIAEWERKKVELSNKEDKGDAKNYKAAIDHLDSTLDKFYKNQEDIKKCRETLDKVKALRVEMQKSYDEIGDDLLQRLGEIESEMATFHNFEINNDRLSDGFIEKLLESTTTRTESALQSASPESFLHTPPFPPSIEIEKQKPEESPLGAEDSVVFDNSWIDAGEELLKKMQRPVIYFPSDPASTSSPKTPEPATTPTQKLQSLESESKIEEPRDSALLYTARHLLSEIIRNNDLLLSNQEKSAVDKFRLKPSEISDIKTAIQNDQNTITGIIDAIKTLAAHHDEDKEIRKAAGELKAELTSKDPLVKKAAFESGLTETLLAFNGRIAVLERSKEELIELARENLKAPELKNHKRIALGNLVIAFEYVAMARFKVAEDSLFVGQDKPDEDLGKYLSEIEYVLQYKFSPSSNGKLAANIQAELRANLRQLSENEKEFFDRLSGIVEISEHIELKKVFGLITRAKSGAIQIVRPTKTSTPTTPQPRIGSAVKPIDLSRITGEPETSRLKTARAARENLLSSMPATPTQNRGMPRSETGKPIQTTGSTRSVRFQEIPQSPFLSEGAAPKESHSPQMSIVPPSKEGGLKDPNLEAAERAYGEALERFKEAEETIGSVKSEYEENTQDTEIKTELLKAQKELVLSSTAKATAFIALENLKQEKTETKTPRLVTARGRDERSEEFKTAFGLIKTTAGDICEIYSPGDGQYAPHTSRFRPGSKVEKNAEATKFVELIEPLQEISKAELRSGLPRIVAAIKHQPQHSDSKSKLAANQLEAETVKFVAAIDKIIGMQASLGEKRKKTQDKTGEPTKSTFQSGFAVPAKPKNHIKTLVTDFKSLTKFSLGEVTFAKQDSGEWVQNDASERLSDDDKEKLESIVNEMLALTEKDQDDCLKWLGFTKDTAGQYNVSEVGDADLIMFQAMLSDRVELGMGGDSPRTQYSPRYIKVGNNLSKKAANQGQGVVSREIDKVVPKTHPDFLKILGEQRPGVVSNFSEIYENISLIALNIIQITDIKGGVIGDAQSLASELGTLFTEYRAEYGEEEVGELEPVIRKLEKLSGAMLADEYTQIRTQITRLQKRVEALQNFSEIEKSSTAVRAAVANLRSELLVAGVLPATKKRKFEAAIEAVSLAIMENGDDEELAQLLKSTVFEAFDSAGKAGFDKLNKDQVGELDSIQNDGSTTKRVQTARFRNSVRVVGQTSKTPEQAVEEAAKLIKEQAARATENNQGKISYSKPRKVELAIARKAAADSAELLKMVRANLGKASVGAKVEVAVPIIVGEDIEIKEDLPKENPPIQESTPLGDKPEPRSERFPQNPTPQNPPSRKTGADNGRVGRSSVTKPSATIPLHHNALAAIETQVAGKTTPTENDSTDVLARRFQLLMEGIDYIEFKQKTGIPLEFEAVYKPEIYSDLSELAQFFSSDGKHNLAEITTSLKTNFPTRDPISDLMLSLIKKNKGQTYQPYTEGLLPPNYALLTLIEPIAPDHQNWQVWKFLRDVCVDVLDSSALPCFEGLNPQAFADGLNAEGLFTSYINGENADQIFGLIIRQLESIEPKLEEDSLGCSEETKKLLSDLIETLPRLKDAAQPDKLDAAKEALTLSAKFLEQARSLNRSKEARDKLTRATAARNQFLQGYLATPSDESGQYEYQKLTDEGDEKAKYQELTDEVVAAHNALNPDKSLAVDFTTDKTDSVGGLLAIEKKLETAKLACPDFLGFLEAQRAQEEAAEQRRATALAEAQQQARLEALALEAQRAQEEALALEAQRAQEEAAEQRRAAALVEAQQQAREAALALEAQRAIEEAEQRIATALALEEAQRARDAALAEAQKQQLDLIARRKRCAEQFIVADRADFKIGDLIPDQDFVNILNHLCVLDLVNQEGRSNETLLDLTTQCLEGDQTLEQGLKDIMLELQTSSADSGITTENILKIVDGYIDTENELPDNIKSEKFLENLQKFKGFVEQYIGAVENARVGIIREYGELKDKSKASELRVMDLSDRAQGHLEILAQRNLGSRKSITEDQQDSPSPSASPREGSPRIQASPIRSVPSRSSSGEDLVSVPGVPESSRR